MIWPSLSASSAEVLKIRLWPHGTAWMVWPSVVSAITVSGTESLPNIAAFMPIHQKQKFILERALAMTKAMQIEHEERMKNYRRETRSIVLQQLLIGLPICFGFAWLVSVSVTFVLPLPWWSLAPFAWAVLVVPPVMKSLPTKPKPEDIERERSMHRAAGIE